MAQRSSTLSGNRKHIVGALLLAGVLILALAASWMRGPVVPEDLGGHTLAEQRGWDASGTVSPDTRDAYQPQRVSILDILGKLSVAVLCIYGVIWGLRWWKDKTQLATDRPAAQNLLKIKEQTHLGQRQKLYLVELGQHIILIADGDGELSLLADLPTEEVYPRSSPLGEQPPLAVIDFGMAGANDTNHAVHGERIRARSQYDQRNWPRRRGLLIKALQQQEQ